jgi:hypothetical protein
MTVSCKGDDMATIKELIHGKALPLKIRCADLSSEWVMVTHTNDVACLSIDSNDNCNAWLLSSENWELYEEPKKKVKVALYAYKNYRLDPFWRISSYMYSNDKNAKPMLGAEILKRLDWSEIEVDDE